MSQNFVRAAAVALSLIELQQRHRKTRYNLQQKVEFLKRLTLRHR